jgi:TonB family protein
MKKLALAFAAVLAAFPLWANVPASFESALSAYNADEHELAREAFLRMARDGRPDAQFNLAAMQARGEGGPVRTAESVLWMTLASDAGFGKADKALEILSERLTDEGHAWIRERLPVWRTEHSKAALFELHSPEFCEECVRPETAFRHADRDQLTHLVRNGSLRLERKRPRYPRDAASNRIVGHVEMGGWLNENGELEAPHVLSSEPEGVFENSALDAFERWEFDWLVPMEDRGGFHIHQTIQFTLNEFDSNYRLERRLRHDLAVGLDDAGENALPAYIAANTLDFIGLEVDPAHPPRLIEVAEQAARQGAVIAQLDLARRLLAGDEVQRDTDAGIFWLKQAAFAGDARAQYKLSFREEALGEEVAADFRAESVGNRYVPALLAEIRRETQERGEGHAERIARLIQSLPGPWQRRQHDDPMLQRAVATMSE